MQHHIDRIFRRVVLENRKNYINSKYNAGNADSSDRCLHLSDILLTSNLEGSQIVSKIVLLWTFQGYSYIHVGRVKTNILIKSSPLPGQLTCLRMRPQTIMLNLLTEDIIILERKPAPLMSDPIVYWGLAIFIYYLQIRSSWSI